jgi:hypothetical protein
MLYTVVFMLVAVAAYLVVNSLQESEIPLQQNTLAREVGQGFAEAATLAVKGGTGFSYNYTFPKSIFGSPYYVDFRKAGSNFIILDWAGPYGNFSSAYDLPVYGYSVTSGCISGSVLDSSKCSNMLMFINDGETLTITQAG